MLFIYYKLYRTNEYEKTYSYFQNRGQNIVPKHFATKIKIWVS